MTTKNEARRAQGLRIKEAREALEYSQAFVARKLGVTRNSVSIWEQGNGGISSDNLTALAELLHTTRDWLAHGPASIPPLIESPRPNAAPAPTPHGVLDASLIKDVPAYGTVAGSLLGNGRGSFQLTSGPIAYVRRPAALENDRQLYALYVEGDSMSPKFEPGDLVFVRPNQSPKVGDAVILHVQEGEHAQTKFFIKILERRTEKTVICRQFNPLATVEFPSATVIAIHRVLTNNEIHGA